MGFWLIPDFDQSVVTVILGRRFFGKKSETSIPGHYVQNGPDLRKKWCKIMIKFRNFDYKPRKRTTFVIQIDDKKSKLLY